MDCSILLRTLIPACLLSIPCLTMAAITVVSRDVSYTVDLAKEQEPAPAAAPAQEQAPAPKNLIDVPYGDGQEILYAGDIYKEPGAPRELQTALVSAAQMDTLEGFMNWKIWYRISPDEGKTWDAWRPVVQQGPEYSPMHPIRPVQVGKNGFCVSTVPPFHASNGEVMVPFYFPPLDENGVYYNPMKAFTFSDGGVLIGRWTEDGKDITWDLGQTVRLEGNQSTRGVDEPAVMELKAPGTFLMVIRGSNDGHPETPSYKWKCVSRDFCRTWSAPEPFGYSDGTPFFSPAACSALIRSSRTGKLYWIGNICTQNANSNSPRYPLVIGEVDEGKLGLIRESVVVIDDRNPEKDTEQMQLSNFSATEEAETGRFVVKLYRIDPGIDGWEKAKPPGRYVIAVE